MAKHETRKNDSKLETVARRAKRSAKYAYAATFTKSGRTAQTLTKGAW